MILTKYNDTSMVILCGTNLFDIVVISLLYDVFYVVSNVQSTE